MFAPFHYAFVQRGMLEALLLSIPAGILGTWIVLRGLAFFSHAVGTAAFPGLVLAAGLGWPGPAGAAVAVTAYTLGVESLASRRESNRETTTGLVLVGALALGVVLASDVFHSGANVETLLFGSLLLVGSSDVRLAAIAAAVTVLLSATLGRRWLAVGFERETARGLGVRSALVDGALLAVVAFAVVASLSAVGALLVAALFVVPAATTRLWCRRLPAWQVASVGLAAAEAVAGLWLSVEVNAPPGPAIAVLAGGVFVALALARLARPRALLALLAVLLLAGCGSSSGGSGLRVVATTTQVADWVRAVGGDDVNVHQILQPNTDPHEYEPRPKDVEATAGAKIIFENGDRLDSWMSKVIEQAGQGLSVELGVFVPVRLPGEASGPEASRFDPHWWHDPRNAEAAVRAIRATLVALDPSHRTGYRRRAAAYLAKLRALDRSLAACFARLPRSERKLVTDHDAFGYFTHRYGLDVVGAVIPSQTTQAQPSAGATARLVRLIRREHVRAVFPESSVNRRVADTIARETGATSRYTLYGDTLGPAGSPGATYLGMERANADAIVRGLSGGRLRCAP
ncbi:MAG TPA: zinc ABC transporter substrate-binding protein [Gaiellaceae bacterium]|jgi:ABC-type Zn uptake system ZnuABC Zn-binding protein ZnuA|nr:zinc ABC transporter substrate-binding protein [Gaiellaceae bacterium]